MVDRARDKFLAACADAQTVFRTGQPGNFYDAETVLRQSLDPLSRRQGYHARCSPTRIQVDARRNLRPLLSVAKIQMEPG